MAKARKRKSPKSRRGSSVSVSVRRNPPRSVGQVVKPVMEAFMNSFLTVAGVWGAGFVGKYLGDMLPKISDDPDMQKAFGQAVTAAVATGIAAFTLPPKVVPYIGVGTFAAPVTTLVKMANIRVINEGLGAYARRAAMGAYVDPSLIVPTRSPAAFPTVALTPALMRG